MFKTSRSAFQALVRSVVVVTALASAPACVRGPGGVFLAMAGTALVTAAVVSAVRPPPPRVVVVPAPQPGYVWQPGYWTRSSGEWVWIDGRWIVAQPHYDWVPTHWEAFPDGTWRLVPGRWVPVP